MNLAGRKNVQGGPHADRELATPALDIHLSEVAAHLQKVSKPS
jgi:hypothetical protein